MYLLLCRHMQCIYKKRVHAMQLQCGSNTTVSLCLRLKVDRGAAATATVPAALVVVVVAVAAAQNTQPNVGAI
jgi:hypothetical protein